MAKKSFKNSNPALQFMTIPAEEHAEEPVADAEPAHNTDNTQYTHNTQTKSKRLNLLIYPATLENLKKISVMQHKSVNALINDVLTAYTEENKDQVEKYNQTFND